MFLYYFNIQSNRKKIFKQYKKNTVKGQIKKEQEHAVLRAVPLCLLPLFFSPPLCSSLTFFTYVLLLSQMCPPLSFYLKEDRKGSCCPSLSPTSSLASFPTHLSQFFTP